MKPYETIRLTESPDVGDIQAEGRKSSVGRFAERGGDFKSYIRDARVRAKVRRGLKKADRNHQARIDRRDGRQL